MKSICGTECQKWYIYETKLAESVLDHVGGSVGLAATNSRFLYSLYYRDAR